MELPAFSLSIKKNNKKYSLTNTSYSWYTQNLLPFEGILHKYGVMHDKNLRLLIDGEHVHSSRDEFIEEFARLGNELSMEPYDR